MIIAIPNRPTINPQIKPDAPVKEAFSIDSAIEPMNPDAIKSPIDPIITVDRIALVMSNI
jgi:hypothetical protein